MILIDSCVWIDWLKGKQTPAVNRLLQIQQSREPAICINSIVYFEVLRGIRSDLERRQVQRDFDLIEKKEPSYSNFSHLVKMYIESTKKGFTIHKLGDWLILKTVLDHSLTLLTSDQDFFRLQKTIPFLLDSF